MSPAMSGSPSPPAGTAVNVGLEVEGPNPDTDSSYGDEISAYTASLTSSINNFLVENGRLYHSFRGLEPNMFPSDERESDRLDMHHALMLLLLEAKLHWAPLGPSPQRVLDLGTGTGIWAMDFADQYPSAEVIGVDLTPIQPTNVPPNLRFIIDDIEDDWAYEKHPFDYVHGRYLATAIRDWPRLVGQAYNCVKPGGWVEFQDWDLMLYSTDGSLTEEHLLSFFHNTTCTRRKDAGYHMQPGPELEVWLRDAGFANVQIHKLPIPLGPWPKDKRLKEIGVWNYLQFDAGLEAIALGALSRTAGKDRPWTYAEVQVLIASMRKEMRSSKIHGLYDL